MMMMLLQLLLLLPCVCNSYSYQQYYYGEMFRIYLEEDAHTVDFRPQDGSEEQILWYRNHPLETKGRGWKVTSFSLVKNMTQRDSGRYVVRAANATRLSSHNIKVIAKIESVEVESFHPFSFAANVEPSSCNIYYAPEGKDERQIVLTGSTLWEFYNSGCNDFILLKPCGIENGNLISSCNGRFTIRDQDKLTAMEVTLTVESNETPLYLVIIGFMVVFIIIFCCVIRCSYGRMKKTRSELPGAPEPAVDYQEYEREPTRLTREQYNQPSRNQHGTPSSVNHPLTHGPLPLDDPPSYSEITAQTPPPPFTSEPGLRYELSGTNMDSTAPLNSAPKYSDVFNSDKLNFL